MATGLHLSTIGFTVRNALVTLGKPTTLLDLTVWLQQFWGMPGLFQGEIAAALAELERRGMVKQGEVREEWQATDARIFRLRSREQDGMSEDDHWEGWLSL